MVEVKPRTPKPSRARKVITYAVDSDEEDDVEASDESEPEDPDSEFDDE